MPYGPPPPIETGAGPAVGPATGSCQVVLETVVELVAVQNCSTVEKEECPQTCEETCRLDLHSVTYCLKVNWPRIMSENSP